MLTTCPYCLKVLSDKKITRPQQKGLYLFFEWIANAHNELGITLLKNVAGMDIELRFTANLVKYEFWVPIQVALYDFETTTKLDTEKINTIADIIIKFLGDKGFYIDFPNMQAFLNEMDKRDYKD